MKKNLNIMHTKLGQRKKTLKKGVSFGVPRNIQKRKGRKRKVSYA